MLSVPKAVLCDRIWTRHLLLTWVGHEADPAADWLFKPALANEADMPYQQWRKV